MTAANVIPIGPIGPTDPSFLDLLLEDVERADLAALGINLGAERDIDQARRDAEAAYFLRIAQQEESQIARHKAALEYQVQLITQQYDRQIKTHTERRANALRYVEHLAAISADLKGFGKKKSAVTPFGEFGYRDASETVEISDADALLAHLKANDPARVRVTITVPLAQAREFLTDSELEATRMTPAWADVKKALDPSGTLPPGVEKVPATRTLFAKPFPPTTSFPSDTGSVRP